MKTALSFIFLSIILSVCACTKDKGSADNVPPVITIANPLNGQIFTNGQSIPISGTISDNEYIAEVHIHVTNTNTGALLMDVHKFPAAATLTFNESITAVSGINYKIQVVTTDRKVNETRSTVNVSCN